MKKIRRYFTLMLICSFFNYAFSKSDFNYIHINLNESVDTIKKAQLKGNVLDEQGRAQEYVGVSLYRLIDSAFVQGVITDSLGAFQFLNILPDNYYLKGSIVGAKPAYSALIKLEAGAVITSPPLILNFSATTLGTVQVTSSIATVERKSDRFTIKVKESAVASGTSIDLLKATPFVSISGSNEVSLQGKKTLILVDHKPIPDVSVESILQMIPAGNIVSIELITNPSAKYDATYGAVIDIITKKNLQDGYTGNVRIDGARGEYGQFGANTSLTYKKGITTAFGTLAYRKSDQMSFNKTKRVLSTVGTPDQIDEEIKRVFYQQFYSVQAGVQFDLKKDQTIGALFTTNPLSKTGNFTSKNRFSKLDAPVDSILNTDSPFKNTGTTDNYNLNYHLSADSGKTELSALVTYTPYRSNFYQTFSSFISGQNDNDTLRTPLAYKTKNDIKVDIWISQIDFNRTFKKQWKLEAGLKNQIADSHNQIIYEENRNETYSVVSEYSNNNKLKEIISAAYGIVYKDWKKDKIQVGLRLENTNATFSNVKPQQYLRLFPTLFYEHDINEKYNLSLSYKKTIDRTPYNEMVPYIIFVNQYTVFTGNPQLRPQYNDLVTLNVNLNKVNVSFNYASTKGLFAQFASYQDFNTKVTYFAWQNMEKASDFYIDIFYPLTISSWWKTQNSGSVFGYTKATGTALNEKYSLSSTWYNFKTDHTFTFSKNVKLEVIGYYTSSYTSELTHIGAVANVDASFLLSVLKGKGQIRVGASDILKRNVYHSDQYFANYNAEKSRYGDSRRISVGFTYNFGKLLKRPPGKELGNDDALDRI